MKIAIYTLNENGTVPKTVLDGGYFPTLNIGSSPQDYDFIGSVNDDFIGVSFETAEDLADYLDSNNFIFVHPITNELVSAQNIANNLWNRLKA
jgi:hypothetical protein